MTDFLLHLKDAASSTLALAAYAVAAAAWLARAWLVGRPQQKARAILATFKSDAERNAALAKLLDTPPPAHLRRDEILAWTRMKVSERNRSSLLAAYLATLAAIIVIFGMALFGGELPGEKEPKLIDVQVDRPDLRKFP